ncbi:MAG TPA: copper homeostasis protein CutC [Gemmatimonadaceae bacterium]|jgi:copper homeostasis protein|nr:copper homeostasis protein CutC [Gemmatimonadaceae bacterium]
MSLVEAAVDTIDAIGIAERAGVERIELCAALSEGGVTPSWGFIAAATARPLPVVPIIRPRGGNFVYSRHELDIMRRDIAVALSLGARGIAAGALRENGEIDGAAVEDLVTAADGAPVTFHRAFDSTPDLSVALDQLIALGVARILTSGGAPSALEGVATIARLVEQARGRISVMAGGKIREDNVAEIIARTGVTEVHARALDEPRMRALASRARGPLTG